MPEANQSLRRLRGWLAVVVSPVPIPIGTTHDDAAGRQVLQIDGPVFAAPRAWPVLTQICLVADVATETQPYARFRCHVLSNGYLHGAQQRADLTYFAKKSILTARYACSADEIYRGCTFLE
jgi:hypothetical protein